MNTYVFRPEIKEMFMSFLKNSLVVSFNLIEGCKNSVPRTPQKTGSFPMVVASDPQINWNERTPQKPYPKDSISGGVVVHTGLGNHYVFERC